MAKNNIINVQMTKLSICIYKAANHNISAAEFFRHSRNDFQINLYSRLEVK